MRKNKKTGLDVSRKALKKLAPSIKYQENPHPKLSKKHPHMFAITIPNNGKWKFFEAKCGKTLVHTGAITMHKSEMKTLLMDFILLMQDMNLG